MLGGSALTVLGFPSAGGVRESEGRTAPSGDRQQLRIRDNRSLYAGESPIRCATSHTGQATPPRRRIDCPGFGAAVLSLPGAPRGGRLSWLGGRSVQRCTKAGTKNMFAHGPVNVGQVCEQKRGRFGTESRTWGTAGREDHFRSGLHHVDQHSSPSSFNTEGRPLIRLVLDLFRMMIADHQSATTTWRK